MRKAARCKGGHRAGGFHPLLEISPCPQLSGGAACNAVKALGAVGGCYPAVKHLYNLTSSGPGARILLLNKEISQNRLQVSKKLLVCWFMGNTARSTHTTMPVVMALTCCHCFAPPPPPSTFFLGLGLFSQDKTLRLPSCHALALGWPQIGLLWEGVGRRALSFICF